VFRGDYRSDQYCRAVGFSVNKISGAHSSSCVPAVIGLLAVWWHKKPKPKPYIINEAGTLVASRRVCFQSFWVIHFMYLFSRKKGI